MQYKSKKEYEAEIASTRDARMTWWREARFGMFIHYGLYSQVGRNEWVMTLENIPIKEYEELANGF
jgi:alpha-L-fucosidase